MTSQISHRPKRSGERAYVQIINGGGCYSSVGRMGRKQDLSLASRGCTSEGTVAHEFIHAIGFHHEQNRPDRDKYVKINWHNIRGRMKHNFEIQRGSKTFNVKYDGRSIMHYFSTAFGGSRNTIEAKPVSKFLGFFKFTNDWYMHSLYFRAVVSQLENLEEVDGYNHLIFKN